MVPFTSLLSKLHRSLSAITGLGQPDYINRSLLGREEILELLYKAEFRSSSTHQNRDIALNKIGDMRSVYRGYGMDFEESRTYMAGDELRFMNWRLTARTGQPYMKVFREERRPGAFIVIDRRTSMRFGSHARLKATQAVRAAAIAAFTAQTRHMPVAGVILEQETHWIGGANADNSAFNLILAASNPCPPLMQSPVEPSLLHILKILTAILPRGSQVYLISDFHDLDDTARPTLLQLATDHQVYAIRVFDRVEQQLPSMGKLKFSSFPGDEFIDLDTSSAQVRSRYNKTAHHHFKMCHDLFDSAGIPYQQVPADMQDIENAVPGT